jgi:hypothetical protein
VPVKQSRQVARDISVSNREKLPQVPMHDDEFVPEPISANHAITLSARIGRIMVT